MSNVENQKATWIQLSDLHVFDEAKTVLMLNAFEKLANVISPQFIVVTGDFRHLQKGTKFSAAKGYLEKIAKKFGINKEDIYIVPGNHDVNFSNSSTTESLTRIGAVYKALSGIEENYTSYEAVLENLEEGFSEYKDFVNSFYDGSSVSDNRILTPQGVFCSLWRDKLNIIHINTALVSDGSYNKNGDKLHSEIVDINGILHCIESIDVSRPSIMIAHHSIDSLHDEHKQTLKDCLTNFGVSAYLHGDIHKYRGNSISCMQPNHVSPEIACGKSCPQAGDDYSDIGIIYYSWENDDNVYVYAYKWDTSGFVKNNSKPFVYDVDKPFFFPMLYKKPLSHERAGKEDTNSSQKSEEQAACEERLYLEKIIDNNRLIHRRDSCDYELKPLVDTYTYPVFSNNEKTPIVSEQGSHVIVTSPSGYGKSLAIQSLALLYASQTKERDVDEACSNLSERFNIRNSAVPIIVRGKDFSEGERERELLDYAVYSVPKDNALFVNNKNMLVKKCQEGKAILLLDSFDEVCEECAEMFIRLVNGFITTFPHINVVLTSRTVEGLLTIQNSGFRTIRIDAFGDSEIEEQISKRALNANISEEIKKRIKGNLYLHGMASNPIMLANMLFMMKDSPNSKSIVDFLDDITNSIIRQRWNDFDIIQDDDIRTFLAGIAWKQLCEKTPYIEKDKMTSVAENVCSQLKDLNIPFRWRAKYQELSKEARLQLLVKNISRRSGIINLEENKTKYTFQDDIVKWYLGALYLKKILIQSENERNMNWHSIILPLDEEIGTVVLDDELVSMLIMSFSIVKRHQQKALLYYLLCRAWFSNNTYEIKSILAGLLDLLKNSFGKNDVLNVTEYRENIELKKTVRCLYYLGDSDIKSYLNANYLKEIDL